MRLRFYPTLAILLGLALAAPLAQAQRCTIFSGGDIVICQGPDGFLTHAFKNEDGSVDVGNSAGLQGAWRPQRDGGLSYSDNQVNRFDYDPGTTHGGFPSTRFKGPDNKGTMCHLMAGSFVCK